MNIRDIAALAGVSTATVSRAVNNPDSVLPETRERILTVIKESGYHPTVKASPKSGTLLFLFNEADYIFYDEIFSGFQSILSDSDYVIAGCPVPNTETLRHKILKSFSNSKISGVIWALRDYYPEEISWFRNHGIPIVLARKYSHAPENMSRCYVDFTVGSQRMTDHLLEIGCRKIFLMVEKVSFQFVNSFCSGWKSAFFLKGLPFDENWIIHTPNSFQGGYEKGLELLQSENAPDAFFCASNEMALGILRAAKDLNIPVPEKLAVTGFTDSPSATCTVPQLTTLNQPIRQLGALTARMLLDIIQSTDSDLPGEVVLQPRLCIRESCGMSFKTPKKQP